MSRAELRRRINAIAAAIRPAHSIAARLHALTIKQRASFEHWKIAADQWHRDHPAARAYQSMLDGDAGPQLERDVSDALFGPALAVTVNMDDAAVAEIWRRVAFGD